MLLRVFLEGLPSLSADWTLLFYVLSVVTMTVGNIAALTQSNTKRMLAYSSIAHAGYLLIGVIAGTSRGVAAMLIYLVIYAFMQMGAFAVVILLRRADAIGDELKDLSGLYSRQPFAAVAMLIFMLSLGGIPPTAGFMGKFWLFSAAIDSNYVWLAVLGVVNSAISLYYYLRVVVFMFMKHESAGSRPVLARASPSPWSSRWSGRWRSASTRGRCSNWRSSRPAPWASWAWQRRRSKKKQEARSKNQEARSQKPEARRKAASGRPFESANPESRAPSPEPLSEQPFPAFHAAAAGGGAARAVERRHVPVVEGGVVHRQLLAPRMSRRATRFSRRLRVRIAGVVLRRPAGRLGVPEHEHLGADGVGIAVEHVPVRPPTTSDRRATA